MAVLVNDPTALVNDPRHLVNGGTVPDDPTAPSAPYGLTDGRTPAVYELSVWQRTPNQTTAATYVEIGPIKSPTITWGDELDRDGKLQASCQPDRLDEDVRQALRDALTPSPSPQGVELRLLRDGAIVWAGPLVGGQIQGGTLSLTARGLGYYLRYMWVTGSAATTYTFTGSDEFTIGKWLVDHWQALDYGHFGIDTSSIGTSGTTRDRTYVAAENPNVHQELERLASVAGFNWWIDPATRQLNFGTRGTDLSSTVVLDSRNIGDEGIAADTAADEFASEAFGVGTSADSDPITSTQSNTTVRQSFGRVGIAASFDGVSVQGTLDDHTSKLVDDHDRPAFVPGPKLIPVIDADIGDFGPGDTVPWEYDAGLGLQTFTGRLHLVQGSVGPNGGESIAVSFAYLETPAEAIRRQAREIRDLQAKLGRVGTVASP